MAPPQARKNQLAWIAALIAADAQRY